VKEVRGGEEGEGRAGRYGDLAISAPGDLPWRKAPAIVALQEPGTLPDISPLMDLSAAEQE
jgi:hypothetical protein